jgi:hypothetical protein
MAFTLNSGLAIRQAHRHRHPDRRHPLIAAPDGWKMAELMAGPVELERRALATAQRLAAQQARRAELEAFEDELAAGELRLTRVRNCLERQQAGGWDTHSTVALLQAMQALQAQWRRQRRDLLDELWLER